LRGVAAPIKVIEKYVKLVDIDEEKLVGRKMRDQTKVLIILGHTDINNSVANKQIIANLREQLPCVELSSLSELYPDYRIDISTEQTKLLAADIIVLQFPVFWYNIPSLLQKWLEDVFQHGFSHGSTGDKLRGKKLIISFTTGAPEKDYHKNGVVEIANLFPNLLSTCKMCGMEYGGYVYTGGVSYQIRNSDKGLSLIMEKANRHTQELITLINQWENKR